MKEERTPLIIISLFLVCSIKATIVNHHHHSKSSRHARKLEADDYLPNFDQLSSSVDEAVAKTLFGKTTLKHPVVQKPAPKNLNMTPSRLENYMTGPLHNPYLNFGMPMNSWMSPIQPHQPHTPKQKSKLVGGKKIERKTKVDLHCKSVRNDAIKIANQILRRQNRDIYQHIMDYVLKSKYLVGVTEIKLVKTLEKKIKKLMSDFSSFSMSNVSFTDNDFDDIMGDFEGFNDLGPEVDSILEGDIDNELN